MTRIGILTGGGDCPGLNAVIRAVVLSAARGGDEVVGFLDGWRGVIEDHAVALDVERCRDIVSLGGTILGTSRTNPYRDVEGPSKVRATVRRRHLDAMVVVGGEDTLGAADRLWEDGIVAAVGVPKTIDNDLSATEVTFGFDTAVEIATEAIDRLRTTAESHHRVIVCEVMGRHAGWIATHAGLAGGAEDILVPEVPFDLAALCARLAQRHRGGRFSSIVVVSEGAVPADPDEAAAAAHATATDSVDQFGHARLGGIGAWLAEQIERRTGYESRVTILGHVQRGGTPTAFDRVLASRFGVAAVAAVRDQAWGTMVALEAGKIVRVPLTEALREAKTVDRALLDDVAAIVGE